MEFDLVLEGGGAKGLAFIGAMEVFENAGYSFDRVVGTSAGAIMATFLAAGYSADEMQAAMLEQVGGKPVYAQFMEEPPEPSADSIYRSDLNHFIRDLDVPVFQSLFGRWFERFIAQRVARHPQGNRVYSLFDRGGLFSADFFTTWLKQKLDEGIYKGERRNFSDMSLHEFYKATQVELTMIASDVTDQRLLVLNNRTAPNLPLVSAIRMSMSLPFIWQEVAWRPEWGFYRGVDLTGNWVVDGGLLSNFPLELLISNDRYVTDLVGENHTLQVLGLMIDESREVPNAPPSAVTQNSYVRTLANVKLLKKGTAVIDMMTSARGKDVARAYKDMVVHLPAKGYGTTEFNMSEVRREALVDAGRQAMYDYFSRPELESIQSAEPEFDRLDEARSVSEDPAMDESMIEDANHRAREILGG